MNANENKNQQPALSELLSTLWKTKVWTIKNEDVRLNINFWYCWPVFEQVYCFVTFPLMFASSYIWTCVFGHQSQRCPREKFPYQKYSYKQKARKASGWLRRKTRRKTVFSKPVFQSLRIKVIPLFCSAQLFCAWGFERFQCSMTNIIIQLNWHLVKLIRKIEICSI